MQTTLKDYLRLSIIDFNLMQHVKIKKLNTKQQSIKLLVIIGYEQNGKIIKNFQFSQFVNYQNTKFQNKYSKWQTTQINANGNFQDKNIHIQYVMIKTQQKSSTDIFKLVMKSIQKQSQNKNQLGFNQFNEQLPEKNQSKIKQKPINLPFCSKKITIPLKKFLNLPYKHHQISIDLYIQGKKQQTTAKQRDGMMNIRLMYLPMIQYQLHLKNIKLKSSQFSKEYKLFVNQIQQSIGKEDKKNINIQRQSAKNKQNQIILSMVEWQNYQNKQSFSKYLNIPLSLNSSNQNIQLQLKYNSVDQNTNQKDQKSSQRKNTLRDCLNLQKYGKQNKKMTEQFYAQKIAFDKSIELSFQMRLILKSHFIRQIEGSQIQNSQMSNKYQQTPIKQQPISLKKRQNPSKQLQQPINLPQTPIKQQQSLQTIGKTFQLFFS